MKNRIIKILLYTIYTLFLFIVIGESLISWYAPQPKFVEKDVFQPDCFESDSLVGFRLRKHAACRFVNMYKEYDVVLHTNSLGYRGKEFALEKQVGKTRIMILGDSFAMGYGVNDNETIPIKLEELLHNERESYEVINAGYQAGFTVDTYYSYLMDRGFLLKPDILVMTIFPFNDIPEILETKWTNVDEKGLPRKVELLYRDIIDGRMVRKIKEIQYKIPVLRNSNLYLFLLNSLKRMIPSIGNMTVDNPKGHDKIGCVLDPTCIDYFKEEEDKFYSILSSINEESKKRNTQFFIVLIPTDYQLYPFAFQKYWTTYKINPKDPNFIGQRISNKLETIGIRTYDLYDDLKRHESSGGVYPYYIQDGHFNSIGTDVAAKTLYNIIHDK